MLVQLLDSIDEPGYMLLGRGLISSKEVFQEQLVKGDLVLARHLVFVCRQHCLNKLSHKKPMLPLPFSDLNDLKEKFRERAL